MDIGAFLPYVPPFVVAVFLNTADIYFLQPESVPKFHLSFSYWLYLLGHSAIALLAAFLLYDKAGMPASDWPIVSAIAGLSGFSILQSLTLKFGDSGVDAHELFDAWKRRVVEDVSRANLSQKRATQLKVAQSLAEKAKADPTTLEAAIRLIAPTLKLNADDLLDRFAQSPGSSTLLMAQWITTTDIDYAQSLL